MASDPKLRGEGIAIPLPLRLIPVGLKEAALDSPTFRATAVHYAEQFDAAERWLESYIKAATKVGHEASAFELLINSWISHTNAPQQISDAILDHDYTILATQKYGDIAKEFWTSILKSLKRFEAAILDPIRNFLTQDLRYFKEARRTLDTAQKNFDNVMARYASQGKSKEASALREDAFQLHEARKAYLKASMDFCTITPQVRSSLDKVLVKIFSEQWRELKASCDMTSGSLSKFAPDMERVRGWSQEMENGEPLFKKELQAARRQIEDTAENVIRPSRELDDYASSTVSYIGTQTQASTGSTAKASPARAEKQGWLFQRTQYGKPARTVWVRRWFFVKNGIFSWLSSGTRSGAVEESDKIGVLLCGIRPATQEERRFCFEVKTKDTNIILQAESQAEVAEWISAFEMVKRKALQDPASTDNETSRTGDMAFEISPPIAPEFAFKSADIGEEMSGLDRVGTLSAGPEGGLVTRGSFDVRSRPVAQEREGERTRDKIIEKFDLHRKATTPTTSSAAGGPSAASGIASLISASHTISSMGGAAGNRATTSDLRAGVDGMLPKTSLAPATLANPPAPTNLSKTAIVVGGERSVNFGRREGGMPGGLMANSWGSSNWGQINRLERGEVSEVQPANGSYTPVGTSPNRQQTTKDVTTISQEGQGSPRPRSKSSGADALPVKVPEASLSTSNIDQAAYQREYPVSYPSALKVQDVQFRILFPSVPREEKVVLVFRATWNPNDQQEFPGRVYVTTNEIFFYSHHLGLVLTTGVRLSAIDEVTAAPGRDCDFVYLHLDPQKNVGSYSRITIKVFLEPLRLLQRRLNFLVQNSQSESTPPLEDVVVSLINMEGRDPAASPDHDSWDNMSLNTPVEGTSSRRINEMKASLQIDGNLFRPGSESMPSQAIKKFKLPSKPVIYAPNHMSQKSIERDFEINAKALFHVLFGDKSNVFQLLYCERWAKSVRQSPWSQHDQGRHTRDFEITAEYEGAFGGSRRRTVTDRQVVDVLNDHLCYVISERKIPFYLPYSSRFRMLSKIVITHLGKSKSKLAVYSKVEWSSSRRPAIASGLIENTALTDMRFDAEDLVDVVASQVQRLGSVNRTKKAISIFGQIAQQSTPTDFTTADLPPSLQRRKLHVKEISLTRLLLAWLETALLTLLTGLLNGLLEGASAVAKVLSAHSLLVAVLLLSAALNLSYTSQSARAWWEERGARRYMASLGVGPNAIMSKAVYLRDIDEIVGNQTDLAMKGAKRGRCVQKFYDIAAEVDMDRSAAEAGDAYFTPVTRATVRRLHRTKQHIGAHRHNLLIALRMVNSLERETIQAELDNWLVDENMKCSRIGSIMQTPNSSFSGKTDVKAWYEDYCASCREEQEQRREPW